MSISATIVGVVRAVFGLKASSLATIFAGSVAGVPNTPAQIVANTNDYSPGAGYIQRWSTDVSRNITGMVAGTDGEVRFIINVGAANFVLVNNSGSSSAGNKFTTSSGSDVTVAPNAAATAIYDLTSAVWRIY